MDGHREGRLIRLTIPHAMFSDFFILLCRLRSYTLTADERASEQAWRPWRVARMGRAIDTR